MPAKICIVGRTFGSLKVIKDISSTRSPGGYLERWSLCKCDCGKVVKVRTGAIRSGNTSSCGCRHYLLVSKKLTKHGHSSVGGHSSRKFSATYRTWAAMIQRCVNPASGHFRNYGGRGIRVCKRWLSFSNFLEDMGNRPDNMTIERVDNNGNYDPANCRWATVLEQMHNTRRNRVFTVHGITACTSVLARHFKIHPSTVLTRIKLGFNPEDAFTLPLRY
jgi:hypothetical protein